MDEQQSLGAPYRVEWRGRELRFGPITQGVKASFTSACKMSSILNHRENIALEFVPPLTQEDAMRRARAEATFENDMRSGRYSWGGDLAQNWRTNTKDGELAFLKFLLEAGETPLPGDDVATMRVELFDVLGAITMALLWDVDCPNGQRPTELTEILRIALAKATSPTSTQS